jgi:fibronectin type 3 domain-containing protein
MQNSRRLFALSPWLALTATLTLAGCEGDGTSSDSTASIQSVAAQTPTSPPSSAPLPTPSTSNVTLSWMAPTENTNGSALTDLGGYKIYYGTSPKELNKLVALSNPGLQTYVIDGLAVGVMYYFAVTATATDGTESAQSAVVSMNIS